MNNLEEVRNFFKNDRFAYENGIEIISASAGESECRMMVDNRHMNAKGSVHGGVIFTIADFAFAVAANYDGNFTVSLSNQITYLKPPKGEILTAKCKKISSTRSTCFYAVDVYDSLNNKVAYMTVNGFIKNK